LITRLDKWNVNSSNQSLSYLNKVDDESALLNNISRLIQDKKTDEKDYDTVSVSNSSNAIKTEKREKISQSSNRSSLKHSTLFRNISEEDSLWKKINNQSDLEDTKLEKKFSISNIDVSEPNEEKIEKESNSDSNSQVMQKVKLEQAKSTSVKRNDEYNTLQTRISSLKPKKRRRKYKSAVRDKDKEDQDTFNAILANSKNLIMLIEKSEI